MTVLVNSHENSAIENLKRDLSHQLHEILRRFKDCNSFSELQKIPEFHQHLEEIDRITKGVAYHLGAAIKPRLNQAVRIVHWNVERGKNLPALLNHLKTDQYLHYADIIILTETDIGMARSGNRHVAQEIAQELGFQYLYANSYLCISKGTVDEHNVQEENDLALSGLTLLSRFPIKKWQVIPLPRWLDLIQGPEKCIGKKRALVALLEISPLQNLAVAGVHLEAHSSPRQRRIQMKSILQSIEEFIPPNCPVIIGGDLNTHTASTFNKIGFLLNLFLHSFRGVKRSMEDDFLYPDRFYETLFKEVLGFGYQYEPFNILGQETIIHDNSDPIDQARAFKFMPTFMFDYFEKKFRPWNGRIPLKLDWFMGRGLKVLGQAEVIEGDYASLSPQILKDVPILGENRLSDHYPIGIDIGF